MSFKKNNQPPAKRHHQTELAEWCARKNLGLGVALVGRIPSLAYSFFPLKLPPPACEAVLVGLYNKRIGVNPTAVKKTASFAWPGNVVGHAGPEAKVPAINIFQAERGGLT